MFPSDNMRGSALPSPGDDSQQQAGGSYPAPPANPPDPRAQTTALLVAQVVSGARRLSQMYPAAAEEMRTITGAMQRAQAKIVQSQPAPEVSAPPV
jgi:hypothetical protein